VVVSQKWSAIHEGAQSLRGQRAPETSRSLFLNRVRLNSFAGTSLLPAVFWQRKAASKAPGFGRSNT